MLLRRFSSGGGQGETSTSATGADVVGSIDTVWSGLTENVATSGMEYMGSNPDAMNDHNHYVPIWRFAHSHSFNMSAASHSHSYSIPSHTHTFSVPSHTHTINLPEHTHPIVHGIYEASNSPSSFEIYVNSTQKTKISSTSWDGDITEWLLSDGGTIPRNTWIDVTIVPNDLAYVISSVFIQGFVQSRGGGNY